MCYLSDAVNSHETGITASALQRQFDFSQKAFGPGPRTKGVLDHIKKELKEVKQNPFDTEEWIDIVILALDGALRAGASPEYILETYHSKVNKNIQREWPDWRTADTDKAIEHIRDNK